MLLYHAITCTDTECARPREFRAPVVRGARVVRWVEVRDEGCPIRDPWLPGGLLTAGEVEQLRAPNPTPWRRSHGRAA